MRAIACDESGYEGAKLVGGETDVFAHAGVDLSLDEAAACVVELRRRIRSPALEYKANHLLRERNRAALEWFLAGPVHGRGHVHLVDKTLLLLGRVAADPASASREPAFLAAADELLRGRIDRAGFDRATAGSAARIELRPGPDLLVPAIVRAVERWGGGGPVTIVHDRQTALNEARVALIRRLTGGRLAGLTFVDSRTDARVQVADFLAGVARRVASDELGGRGDATLVALVAPYVDPASVLPACALGRQPSRPPGSGG